MENIKYGRRREGRWTPIWAKAQDTRANPSWENSPSEKEMGHWTPTGVEPKDYDDDDETKFTNCTKLFKVITFIFHNLEKVPVRRTSTFHYKKSTGLWTGTVRVQI